MVVAVETIGRDLMGLLSNAFITLLPGTKVPEPLINLWWTGLQFDLGADDVFRATFCTAVNESVVSLLSNMVQQGETVTTRRFPSLFLGRIYDSFGMKRDDLL